MANLMLIKEYKISKLINNLKKNFYKLTRISKYESINILSRALILTLTFSYYPPMIYIPKLYNPKQLSKELLEKGAKKEDVKIAIRQLKEDIDQVNFNYVFMKISKSKDKIIYKDDTLYYKKYSAYIPQPLMHRLKKYYNGKSDKMYEYILISHMRYNIIESKSLQWSLPSSLTEKLQDDFGFNFEMFASPFNSYYGNFCSLFLKTDKYFGSYGSFFNLCIGLNEKLYIANPPFIEDIMDKAAIHIIKELERVKDKVVIIWVMPTWKDSEAYKLLSKCKFNRFSIELLPNTYMYEDKVEGKSINARFSSTIMLIQNQGIDIFDKEYILDNIEKFD